MAKYSFKEINDFLDAAEVLRKLSEARRDISGSYRTSVAKLATNLNEAKINDIREMVSEILTFADKLSTTEVKFS